MGKDLHYTSEFANGRPRDGLQRCNGAFSGGFWLGTLDLAGRAGCLGDLSGVEQAGQRALTCSAVRCFAFLGHLGMDYHAVGEITWMEGLGRRLEQQ